MKSDTDNLESLIDQPKFNTPPKTTQKNLKIKKPSPGLEPKQPKYEILTMWKCPDCKILNGLDEQFCQKCKG